MHLTRKKCLLLNNLLAIAAAVMMVLSKTAVSFEMIMAARFIYGINAGAAMLVHGLYLSESAPKRLRGMVAFTMTNFICIGKFTGQLLGISELLGTEERWPWLLGVGGVTGLLQMMTLPLLPESPRYLLIMKGDVQACEQAMDRLWGGGVDHSVEMADMCEEAAVLKGVKRRGVLDLLREPSLRWQLLTVICLFTQIQMNGVNAVYQYAFEVFREAGIAPDQMRYAALGTSLCELSSSILCVLVIERTGKKLLQLWGLFGMTGILALLTVTLYLQSVLWWMAYLSLVLIFLHIFISCAPAGVTVPIAGDLFDQSFKAAGFTIGTTVNWTWLFLVGMLFPVIVEYLDYLCFLIFLMFCLGTGLFVQFHVPETRNRTVLEIAAEYKRMHTRHASASASASDVEKHHPPVSDNKHPPVDVQRTAVVPVARHTQVAWIKDRTETEVVRPGQNEMVHATRL
ncbi:solute carrier family 2, facilitated glucose transporter member 9-like [Engraulis encrasicolus]|uniref:solute carrier family 2, facilitated glucose transporter member 9-like n=1 Tax=Engraulis encrasicolus TaxID=184585 RepID=UPI002FD27991